MTNQEIYAIGYDRALNVIKKLFPDIEQKEIDEKIEDLLAISDSIGADYSEETLTKVAKTRFEIS